MIFIFELKRQLFKVVVTYSSKQLKIVVFSGKKVSYSHLFKVFVPERE